MRWPTVLFVALVGGTVALMRPAACAQEPPPPPPQEAPPDYSTAPPADVNYFYNDLSPYGTWAELAGVGWCWQPRVVLINHGWRPYCAPCQSEKGKGKEGP